MMPRHILTNQINIKVCSLFSTPLVQAFFKNSFFGTLMGRGVTKMGSAHVTPKVKLCMHTISKSVAPRVCLVKVPFLAFFLGGGGGGGGGLT